MNVLIAEDEFTTRMLVQVSLENWGYRVESVVDGHAALKVLEKNNAPHIVILDWEMPRVDGVEVCKRVKEMDVENPPYIILLTARDSKNDILQGFDAGADDYMIKPFNDNELRARVLVAERLVRTQISLTESVAELKEALNQLEMLQGGVAVCKCCQKIFSNDDDEWHTLKDTVTQQSDLRFIPAVCPDCDGE